MLRFLSAIKDSSRVAQGMPRAAHGASCFLVSRKTKTAKKRTREGRAVMKYETGGE